MPLFNPELMALAQWRIEHPEEEVKQAFIPAGAGAPPGGAPPGGPPGAPPMDPAAAGGAPPGGDPSGGGAPPMDPSQGVPPPPNGGMDAIMPQLQQMQAQIQQLQAGGGGGKPGGGGSSKAVDAQAQQMDLFHVKKMMSGLYHAMGIPIPQELLDGPNRDPNTGLPLPPGTPGSTSDPSMAPAPPPGGAPGAPPGGAPAGPPPGGPAAAAPPTKQSDVSDPILYMGESMALPGLSRIANKASAVQTIMERLASRKS